MQFGRHALQRGEYDDHRDRVQPRMVIATITYNACAKGGGEVGGPLAHQDTPIMPSAALIKPKSRLVSQRKAMACEMVRNRHRDVGRGAAEGEKRIYRFIAAVTKSRTSMVPGTNSAGRSARA